MLMSIIMLASGFTAGIYYSRGKADPVKAALFDLKRGARACGHATAHVAHRVARAWTGRVQWPGEPRI